MQLFLLLASSVLAASAKRNDCSLPLPNASLPSNQDVGSIRHKMLPMRDGVRLSTITTTPFRTNETQFTTVIDRSPYGFFATELFSQLLVVLGYAGVSQDMRGTCNSEGDYSLWHSDSDDAYDTMEWIVAQQWSNGKVLSIGASADGIASFLMPLADPVSPPWLQAQFIIWATAEAHDCFYPGGAYRHGLVDGWIKGTLPTQADGLVKQVREHEGWGSWWEPVTAAGKYDTVHAPAVFWAGWYDIFLRGNLVGYEGWQKESDPAVRGKSYIVIDPCGHCQAAGSMYYKHTIAGRTALPVLLALQLYQSDGAGITPGTEKDSVDKVTFYVMGSNDGFLHTSPGNYWTTLPDFPAFTETPLFLGPGGTLSFDAPSAASAAVTIVVDPSNPVTTYGGNNLEIPCGPMDQQPAEARDDVLTFTTEALTEALALTGPLRAEIFMSSTAADTDVVVKLTDVYPDGRSILIQDGIQRLRWRGGWVNPRQLEPELIVPGEVYGINVGLWNTSYVFAPGHKIRVALQGSNYPRFSVNRQNGLPLVDEDTVPSVVAHNTFHFSSERPSAFVLPVVPLSALPEIDLIKAGRAAARSIAAGRSEETVLQVEALLESIMSSATSAAALE